MSDTEVEELLPLYALNALDAGEAAVVECAVSAHPRLSSELDTYHELLAALSVSGPEISGGWSRISTQLESPPPLRLIPAPTDTPVTETQVAPLRSTRWNRSASAWRAGLVAAAVSATLMLGMQGLRQTSEVGNLREALGENGMQQVAQLAFADPDSAIHNLSSPDGRLVANLAVAEDGKAYLIATGEAFPSLADQTYQLWGFIDGEHRSLSVMGGSPGVVAFHAPHNVKSFAVTVEPANGSVNPTGSVVASIA